MFRKAYDTCYEKVSWVAAWLLCWPMKLTFVCNIARALGSTGSSGGPCDATKEVLNFVFTIHLNFQSQNIEDDTFLMEAMIFIKNLNQLSR